MLRGFAVRPMGCCGRFLAVESEQDLLAEAEALRPCLDLAACLLCCVFVGAEIKDQNGLRHASSIAATRDHVKRCLTMKSNLLPQIQRSRYREKSRSMEATEQHQRCQGERTRMRIPIGESDRWHGKRS